MESKFELIAKTFQGLEEVLAKEIVKLGGEDVEVLRRGVSFKADKALLYKANLCCRTALRIIKPIYKFKALDADEVYERIKAFEWEQYLDCSKTFAIDAVVYSEAFRHSKFLSYRVKDAIADRFREKTGERPSVRINNPDIQINVHVSHTDVTISLDSSGEPLYKRGYRVEQTEAPINEVLAAGLLMLAGWDGSKDLIDPMCGSGTFLCEAALIAKNIAPGIYRKSFAFEKWPDFDADMFEEIYNDDSQEREFEHTIYGSDILKNAIEIATENVKSAGVANDVKLKVCPIEELPVPSKNALVIFNPPYGERLRPEKLELLYDHIGQKLKKEFVGMDVWIISEPNDAAARIGLAPSVKMNVDNGGIACDFRKYEIFEGRRDDYMRERAMNDNKNAEKKEENLGYTFHVYDYDEPGAKKEEDADGSGRSGYGSYRRQDGSRSARSRVSNFHTDQAAAKGEDTEEFSFETPEEKEAYLERKMRHERFEARQRQQEREQNQSERPRRSEGGRYGDRRGSNNSSYPNDRISGGTSHQRSSGKSWSRDGFHTREERGGTRGSNHRGNGRPEGQPGQRHDFKNDGYKPVRKFDRRRQQGDNK